MTWKLEVSDPALAARADVQAWLRECERALDANDKSWTFLRLGDVLWQVDGTPPVQTSIKIVSQWDFLTTASADT